MAENIRRDAEKAAQRLYEERVEQATREFFECLDTPTDELEPEKACEMAYQEKLMANHGLLQHARKAAASAGQAVPTR